MTTDKNLTNIREKTEGNKNITKNDKNIAYNNFSGISQNNETNEIEADRNNTKNEKNIAYTNFSGKSQNNDISEIEVNKNNTKNDKNSEVNPLLQMQNDCNIPNIIKDLLKKYFNEKQCKNIEHLIFYNTQGGKNSRSKIFHLLLNELNGQRSSLLMFVIELLQASFIIFDDVMDNSEMRRGVKCWYLQKDLTALCDAMLIINLILKIVLDPTTIFFDSEINNDKTKKIKTEIFKFINFVLLKTCIGQTNDAFKFDTRTKENIKKYVTMQNYKEICDGKNGCYTFYFPLKLAFICAQSKEPKNLEKACNAMGLLHQMRDDYLNFYPEQTGKSGNDLEEKKLTYFICKLAENNENLVPFFNSNEIKQTREKLQKYLDCFEEDQNEIVCKIRNYKEKETEKIIEICIDFLTKRKK